MKLTHTHTHTHTHGSEHITSQLSAPTSPHSEPWHLTLDTLPERDISFPFFFLFFCFSWQNFHQSERLLLLLYLYLTLWPFLQLKKNSPNYILPFMLLCNSPPLPRLQMLLLWNGDSDANSLIISWQTCAMTHLTASWGVLGRGEVKPESQNMHQI